jgi:transcriptional regulator with XRE-family HTH domain
MNLKKSPETLSNNLYYFRRSKKMTQQQIADKLHVHRSTYTYYETGACCPSIERIIALADLFEVSLDELVRTPHILCDIK